MEPRNPPPSKQEVYSIAAASSAQATIASPPFPAKTATDRVWDGVTTHRLSTHRSLIARGHPRSCRSLAQHQHGSATSSSNDATASTQSIMNSKSPGGAS